MNCKRAIHSVPGTTWGLDTPFDAKTSTRATTKAVNGSGRPGPDMKVLTGILERIVNTAPSRYVTNNMPKQSLATPDAAVKTRSFPPGPPIRQLDLRKTN